MMVSFRQSLLGKLSTVLNCVTLNFNLMYENFENIKSNSVNAVVVNVRCFWDTRYNIPITSQTLIESRLMNDNHRCMSNPRAFSIVLQRYVTFQ